MVRKLSIQIMAFVNSHKMVRTHVRVSRKAMPINNAIPNMCWIPEFFSYHQFSLPITFALSSTNHFNGVMKTGAWNMVYLELLSVFRSRCFFLTSWFFLTIFLASAKNSNSWKIFASILSTRILIKHSIAIFPLYLIRTGKNYGWKKLKLEPTKINHSSFLLQNHMVLLK